MSSIKDISSNSSNDSNQENEVKQYFINDEKYQLLQQCKNAIYEATELTPSVRKLVNEVITMENLNKIRDKYIKTLQS